MKYDARRPLAAALSVVRQRQPYVIWGNEPMNGGNYLFLWATAWTRARRTGKKWLVRYKPKMDPWLQEFPALLALTVGEEDVRFTQRRAVEWGQNPGVDFLLPDLKAFCREFLLKGSDFCARGETITPGATVINVRRGDYYSVDRHRAQYGFDIRSYVRAARDQLDYDPQRDPVVFVSDDPQWCQENLADIFGDHPARLMPAPHNMFQDLAQLAFAKNLVLANSTFSYWGGYLASSRPPAMRPKRIIAPLFFGRSYDYQESPLLLPEWLALPEDQFHNGALGGNHG